MNKKTFIMKHSIIFCLSLLILLSGCSKTDIGLPGQGFSYPIKKSPFTRPKLTFKPVNTTAESGKAILIDASHDGGTWWYPQSEQTGFSSANYHQGKNFADYLRSLGYRVDELPRGTLITNDILNKYVNVIRAVGFGSYSENEIGAYQSFLNRSSSLLLINDHLSNSVNDPISVQLGLLFTGAYQGSITSFATHPVTSGVSSFPFMVGSVINGPVPSNVTILGSLQVMVDGKNISAGVMGTVDNPNSRIFFIGDINGIETVQQPFTANLVNWLFR